MSVSVRNFIICWSLSWGISSVFAISSILCHTLSLNMVNSFSSFVDKGGCLLISGNAGIYFVVAYILLRTLGLD